MRSISRVKTIDGSTVNAIGYVEAEGLGFW
jgi:hypothetical protein